MKKLLRGTNTQKGNDILTKFRKGVGKHSVLITFICATAGVGLTVYLAQREIPKAKAEIRDVLKKKQPKKQRNKAVIKAVAKNCWRTTVIAIATILLVTGTSAIANVNAATTIAGLTGAAQMAEIKAKSYEKAINDIPDDKTREEVKQAAAKNLNEERSGKCEEKYRWIDKFTGVRFWATFKQVEAAGEITDLKIDRDDRMMLRDFYVELMDMGAIFEEDDWPDFCNEYGWYKHSKGEMKLKLDTYFDDDGYLVHYIEYDEPEAPYWN